MCREAGKGREMVPSYSPHTPHRRSPASPAVLHTGCSGSPRPRPRSSSCSLGGPPGAWKQSQGYMDLTGPGTTSISLNTWLMALTFSGAHILEYLMMTNWATPQKKGTYILIYFRTSWNPFPVPQSLSIYSTNFRLRTLIFSPVTSSRDIVF